MEETISLAKRNARLGKFINVSFLVHQWQLPGSQSTAVSTTFGSSFLLKRKPSQEPQVNERLSMDGNMRGGKEYGN